jgi:ElaB/YqjD/DUF883 family membrane-anchored ribosome-binding protein
MTVTDISPEADAATVAPDAPVEAPQVDVDGMLAEAQTTDPAVYALMVMIKDSFAEYTKLNDAYNQLKSKGEVSITDLLAGITDDQNAAALKEGIEKLQNGLEGLKQKAKALLESKGLLTDAELEEVKGKRDLARTQVNKTNELLLMVTKARPNVAHLADYVEAFKTRNTTATTSSSDENARIRDWAKGKGLEVNERGRIAAKIVEQYRSENPTA